MSVVKPRAFSTTLAMLALIALALFAAGCAVNPATGKHEFTLVTPTQEAALGREGYTAATSEYGIYDDAALAAYVDSVGRKVARASEQPDLPWRFTVLDDATVNAFAMPGGYIYVTRGLLAHMQSEAQLAGVLGHEIGHVTARHSARQMTQQQLAGFGLTLASAVSPTFRRYGSTAEQALGLLMLKYSRDDETQADELGVRYSSVAGFDSREMPGTYRTLQRIAARSGSSLPGYLSTHPDPGDRAERTAALAAKAVAGRANLVVKQRGYLEKLRNLVYGENPRYGWFEGRMFYHPVLGLQMQFPAGWQTQKTRTALTAAAGDQSGMLQMTLARGTAGKSPGDVLVDLSAGGKIAGSKGGSETLGAWPAWIGTVTVPDGAGGQESLVAAWVRITPDIMLQFLGKGATAGDAGERQVLAAIRSISALTDPARGMVQPSRLKVQPAASAGAFRGLWAGLGANLVPAEEGAILNGLELDENVMKGQWLKVAEKVKRP
ncbi:MAG: M48 family metalloprotease [Candidatus Eisenbacteria bacterium]|nr:M48 family metalloprotease [Candidatus Eisenbacteria bacterium]